MGDTPQNQDKSKAPQASTDDGVEPASPELSDEQLEGVAGGWASQSRVIGPGGWECTG